MVDKIIYLNEDRFEKDVLQSKGLFLVDFWAEWCSPCKIIAPILTEVADEFDGKLTVAKLNIEENKTIAHEYGIRSIPTLMLFRDGEVVDTKVGAMSKKQLKEFLNASL